MKSNVTSMFKFLEYGKEHPKGFGKQRTGTISTSDLINYHTYTTRDSAKGIEDYEKELSNAGYLEYTSRDSASIKTFSHLGWINDADTKKELKKQVAEAFSQDGNLAWIPVQSYRDFTTAAQYGLFKSEDYATITAKSLSKFFNYVGLEEENMIWWMDYHQDKDHPHVHLVFLEKEQTRTRGKFTQKQIDYFKGCLYQEMKIREMMLDKTYDNKLDFIKENSVRKNELIETVRDVMKERSDSRLKEQLSSLAKRLPKTGRLQYGSVHMKPFRYEIDKIVETMLESDEVKNDYLELSKRWKDMDTEKSIELNTKYTDVFDTEDSKLRKQMANDLLKYIKDNKLTNLEENEIHLDGPLRDDDSIRKETSLVISSNRNVRDQTDGIYNAELAKQIASHRVTSALKKLEGRTDYEVEQAQDIYYEGVDY